MTTVGEENAATATLEMIDGFLARYPASGRYSSSYNRRPKPVTARPKRRETTGRPAWMTGKPARAPSQN
ncbi:MAG: hypothetical protein HY053_07340 [Proteobacteria bacterium]|nr:hypothetical protein [Pseudomonadota bacterium]